MPAATLITVKNGKLHIGDAVTGVDVDCQVNENTLTPTTENKTYDTICGRYTVPGLTTWVLHLVAAQDWSDPAGVCAFLAANDGAVVPYTLQLTVDPFPAASGELYCAPVAFGGVAGEVADFTVDLGTTAPPTFDLAAP